MIISRLTCIPKNNYKNGYNSINNNDLFIKQYNSNNVAKLNIINKDTVSFKARPKTNMVSYTEMIKLISKVKKKPIIFSDFDGTLYPLYTSPEPYDLINKKEFSSWVKKSKRSKTPFIIITSRSLEQFKLGEKDLLKPAFNIVTMQGNEMLLSLPNNYRSQNFVRKLKHNKKLATKFSIDKRNINIFSTSKVDKKFLNLAKIIKKTLEPLGFIFEDKHTEVTLKGRILYNSVNSSNKPQVIENIDNKVFDEIQEFNKQNGLKCGAQNIIIYNSEKDKRLATNFDTLFDFAKNKIDNYYKRALKKEKIEFKLDPVNKKYHIKLNDYYVQNKGTILNEIYNIYNVDKKYVPIYIGDSFAAKEDDFCPIKVADRLKGFGIGVLSRYPDEIEMMNKPNNYSEKVSNRILQSKHINYLFHSYEDVKSFIEKMVNP